MILELALWKVNMNELSPNNEMENTDTRKHYCVSCGAEFVVPHVLLFFLLASEPIYCQENSKFISV